MRMVGLGLVILCIVLVAGCESCPSDRRENTQLLQQRREFEGKIALLEQQNEGLTSENDLLGRKNDMMEREKQTRIQDAQKLRHGFRGLMDNIQSALASPEFDIKDYYGDELLERTSVEDRSGILLIDRRNRFAQRVQLLGGRAFVEAPTRLVFCLLRPSSADADRLQVVYKSQVIEAVETGMQEWMFLEPFIGEPGDCFAVYALKEANIPCDALGNGDVVSLVMPEPRVAEVLAVSPISTPDRESRSYSFGVIGYSQKQ